MNAAKSGIDELVEELLAVLDADAVLLEAMLGHLNSLRAVVIKRSETELEHLLENIKAQQEQRDAVESRRQKLRQIAAKALGCSAEQVNLTRFMEHLSEEMQQEVAQRKIVLERLVAKLKTEYTATVMMLNECSRFNRVLIDSIIGCRHNAATTYNASGQTQRHDGSRFIIAQF
jgi:hypothetical protein